MTISPANYHLINFIPTGFNQKALKGLRMCELGNQHLHTLNEHGKEIKCGPAKKYFSGLGVKHTSLDLNGEDGAIKVNLSTPLETWDTQFDPFDVVTNFGTSEHCTNQYHVMRNIHMLTRTGGFMVHSVPLHGYWAKHSPYRYTKDFFPQLAKRNGYEIVVCETVPRRKELLLNAVLRKIHAPFKDTPEFIMKHITEQKASVNRDNDAERKAKTIVA